MKTQIPIHEQVSDKLMLANLLTDNKVKDWTSYKQWPTLDRLLGKLTPDEVRFLLDKIESLR